MRVAIICAMSGELAPLTRGWRRFWLATQNDRFRAWQQGDVVAVAARMGTELAALATRAAIALHQPEVIISAGWAGALDPALAVADILAPSAVVDLATGAEFPTVAGAGTLLTISSVAAAQEKEDYARQFGAHAVDMEAAGVARIAHEKHLPFFALKSISDTHNAVRPDLKRFNTADGRFRYANFLAYAVLHPRLWPVVATMAREARAAAASLCGTLDTLMAAGTLDSMAAQVIRLSFVPAQSAQRSGHSRTL